MFGFRFKGAFGFLVRLPKENTTTEGGGGDGLLVLEVFVVLFWDLG